MSIKAFAAPILLTAVVLVVPPAAKAHGEERERARKSQPVVETAFGRTGDPKNAKRTVRVNMSDRMRFTPGSIEVGQGDTVRFIVQNSGRTMHEMVIGTMQGLKQHAEAMKKHPGMEHDEPFMAHVAPGKTGEIVWQFTKPGEFHYGCLIPGHFEAGMVGRIKVVARGQGER